MEDTFSEGVEPGGLRNRSDIRLLICYLLQQVGEQMEPDMILSVMTGSGLANYFEAAAALEELQKTGSLSVSGTAERPLYALTEQGRMVVESLSRDLPASVRQKSVQTAVALRTRMKREAENEVSFTPIEKGYLVRCRIPDGAGDLMTLELRVPDRAQAEQVRRRFMRAPGSFYLVLSALLTGDPVQLSGLPDELVRLTKPDAET